MITRTTIEERKKVIEDDIETVTQRLTENEQKKLEDTALINALTGALQQCNYFLKKIDNEKPEKVVVEGKKKLPIIDNPYGSDDGNETVAVAAV